MSELSHIGSGVAVTSGRLAATLFLRLRHGRELRLPAAVNSYTRHGLLRANLRDAIGLSLIVLVLIAVLVAVNVVATEETLDDSLEWAIPIVIAFLVLEILVTVFTVVRATRYVDPRIALALDADSLAVTEAGWPLLAGKWSELTVAGFATRATKGGLAIKAATVSGPGGGALSIDLQRFPDAEALLNTVLRRLHAAGRLLVLDRHNQPMDPAARR